MPDTTIPLCSSVLETVLYPLLCNRQTLCSQMDHHTTETLNGVHLYVR